MQSSMYPNLTYQPVPSSTTTEASQTDISKHLDEETGVWIQEKLAGRSVKYMTATSTAAANEQPSFVIEDPVKDCCEEDSPTSPTTSETPSCLGWLLRFSILLVALAMTGWSLGLLFREHRCIGLSRSQFGQLFLPKSCLSVVPPEDPRDPNMPGTMGFPSNLRGSPAMVPTDMGGDPAAGNFDLPTEVTRFVDELQSMRYVYQSRFVENVDRNFDPCLPCFFNDSSRISRRRDLDNSVDAFMIYRTTDLPIFEPRPARARDSNEQLLRFTVITHTYAPVSSPDSQRANPFFSFFLSSDEPAPVEPRQEPNWNEIPVKYKPQGLSMGWERGVISGETAVSFCSGNAGSNDCLLKVVLKGNPTGVEIDHEARQTGHPQIGEFQFTFFDNANAPPYENVPAAAAPAEASQEEGERPIPIVEESDDAAVARDEDAPATNDDSQEEAPVSSDDSQVDWVQVDVGGNDSSAPNDEQEQEQDEPEAPEADPLEPDFDQQNAEGAAQEIDAPVVVIF